MRSLFILFLSLPLGLSAQHQSALDVDQEILDYMRKNADGSAKSKTHGSVSNGSLENGKLFPYKGKNFIYFDRDSYLEGRAFLYDEVRWSILSGYDSLYRLMPNRYFSVMECSNKHGGEMFPHRTHQNGLSVDFMMPLLKNNKPYYALDTLGAAHYALSFDDNGCYKRDKTVSIDFDLVARQILLLDHFARRKGMYISKVIIKIELKDELYTTPHGKLLKEKGIYVVQGLSPLINSLHDDHFHIDFDFL